MLMMDDADADPDDVGHKDKRGRDQRHRMGADPRDGVTSQRPYPADATIRFAALATRWMTVCRSGCLRSVDVDP